MLALFNKIWSEYKKETGLSSDLMLDEVRFDAAEGVEASFDLMELLEERYILHVTKNIHFYRGDFVRYLLYHEFTHLSDFITYPYEKPSLDDLKERECKENNINTVSDKNIFGDYGEIHLPEKSSGENIFENDIGKKLFDYMNTYSEFHACQTAFRMILHDPAPGTIIDVNKNQIPTPYKDISVRKLLGETLRRAHIAYQKFETMLVPQVFALYFRQIMYLFGYISFFNNAEDVLEQTFAVLGITDKKDVYLAIYQALKRKEVDSILLISNQIYMESYLLFVKEYVRKHYDPDLYTEEELDAITPDTYHDFLETISNRKGGRIWSGRVSPVYGVHDVNKAYGAVDVETIKEMIGKNKKLPGSQMKPDF